MLKGPESAGRCTRQPVPDDISSGPVVEGERDLAVPATSHDHTAGRHVHTLTLTAIRRRWVPDQAVLELEVPY